MNEVNVIYAEIRETCSLLRNMRISRTMTTLRKNLYQEVMTGHIKKTAKLVYKKFDVEEHINNISTYQLSFFQKLVLCRGQSFAMPQAVSAMDVKASFEKAYWKLDSALPDEKKELAAATFRSVVLNYIERKGPRPLKSLVKAVNELKRTDDIVITKPDKGSGVVVMDRT